MAINEHRLQGGDDGESFETLDSKTNKPFMLSEDIACGLEKNPISCVNWVNEECIPSFEYISTYKTDQNVHIPKDEGFMVHCRCTDGCVNTEGCPCRKLTLDESRGLAKLGHTSIGYENHKLLTEQLSGVYECNQYCQCNSTCSNRVVQQGPQYRFKVYMTENKGWGVMSLDDIPQGSFICCYIGLIVTDDTADKRGLHSGDNYMAELDYIEVLERTKEGCESETNSIFNGSTFSSQSYENAEMFVSSHSLSPNVSDNEDYYLVPIESKRTRLSSTESVCSNSPPLNEVTQTSLTRSSSPSLSRSSLYQFPSCRSYYNEKHCYIVDSQKYGNIARFLNHSCSPNLFVQNVFVDSHDLRFPWVAFFAKTFIKAETELCWDYNYVIGSVEGKQIECLCGAVNCRRRLL